jgi:TolB-like protein/Tfp pilus assembly protein PilF
MPTSGPAAQVSAASPVVERSSSALGRRSAGPLVLAGIALIAFIGAGLWIWTKGQAGRSGNAASIVVLPFIDLTAEKADQAFCDGLTEELSNWLAQIPTLRVVSRTSAFAFRGRGEDVRKIARALDTDHVLEGSMRRSGSHMRVTVQLIDARTGYHLWSEDFDRPMEDAINMQEDISRSVAGTLKVRLTSESERQFAARRTADPEAYQLYLLGRHYQQQWTPEATERAIDLFRQVLAADPKFAPAYAQLAYARLNEGYFHDTPIAEVTAQLEPLIGAALRLDDRMSAAYAVRGALRAAQSRTQEGLEDLQFAISLNPSDMGAFAEMGRIRLFQGQPREALESYDRAAALDPLNFTLQEQRCAVLDDLAEYADAEKACERARVLGPGAASPFARSAFLAESRGRIDEALAWNAAALKAEPTDDFNLYWTRASLYLSIGLAAPARAAVELGRRAAKDEDDANIALVRVIYCEGGDAALRAFLSSVRLDQSAHSVALFEAAYASLLLGDAAAARERIARAVGAPDRPPGFAESPFYARGAQGTSPSYRLDLAAAELALGDRTAAQHDLDTVLAMLDRMIAAGVERYETYELRAKVYALEGRGDEAMRNLDKSVKLGWRRAWWAAHEPYFSSLRSRTDFQWLLANVRRSNDELEKNIKAD